MTNASEVRDLNNLVTEIPDFSPITNVRPLYFSQLTNPQSLTSKVGESFLPKKVKDGWKRKKSCTYMHRIKVWKNIVCWNCYQQYLPRRRWGDDFTFTLNDS